MFVLAPGSTMTRCNKCNQARKNIRPNRIPRLFPNNAASTEPVPELAQPPNDSTILADVLPDLAQPPNKSTLASDLREPAQADDSEPIQPASSVSFSELHFYDTGTLHRRLSEWVASAGNNADPSEDGDISVITKVFKMVGRDTFDINDEQLLVVCSSAGCTSSFIK